MEAMERTSYTPCLVVIGLMVLTSFALAYSVDVTITDQAGLKYELPARVGTWTGHDVRYCQNPRCRREFKLSDMADPDACPSCGSAVDVISLGERQLLPPDTILLKKRYFNAQGEDLFVSVVFSGKERVSIHRPQVCLRSQGRRILDDEVLAVPLAGRADLQVMLLDILHHVTPEQGQAVRIPRFYAYWFAGIDRETPHHWQRMLWMGLDRAFRGVAHRWAYVAVGGARDEQDPGHHRQLLREFVADLYPQILRDRETL